MATVDQGANVARYFFEPAQLAPETFQVTRFRGQEGLSQLFTFSFHLLSTDPDIDFAQVVNKPATFTMMREGEETPINGIVTDFAQAGRTKDHIQYRATLQPTLWRLSLSYQSRIFQEMTVEEILGKVLEEDGLTGSDFRFALSGKYSPREYCVQHQETDLNFVKRLMEYEGIYFFFEHKDGRDVLVMTDARSEHSKIESPSALRYHTGAGDMVDAEPESVRDFVCEEQIVTGTVQLKDYNYRTPETMTVESQMNGQMPGTRYEYGEHFRDAKEGQRLAKVRNEEIEARRRIMEGDSNSMGLRSGYLFALEEHFRSSFNGDYLITHVAHEGSQRAGLSVDALDEQPEIVYKNHFTCIPAATQYRPPRETPKPQISGVMTAKVESAGGDYAYIDDEGRYRAQMHFDQRSDRSDGTKTLPIRMKQAYSGPDYGIHFPNHADTEMLVACENGDIDRPVALGTVPNPSQRAPAIAENKMQNVVRTHAGNQLIMDDTIDKTQVTLESADKNTVLLDDKDDRIRIATTNKHTATFDDKNENIKVQTKNGHFVIMDDKNTKITVQSKNGHFISINDKDGEESITLADKDSKNTFTIDIENEKLIIKTENGDIDMHAENGLIDIKAKTLKMKTTGDTTMEAANIESKANADHKMEATNIEVKAQMDYKQEATNVTSKASMAHKVEGTQVSSKGTAQNEMQGAQASVKGSAMTQIQGGLVKIN